MAPALARTPRVPPVCTSLLGLLARRLEGGLGLVQEDPGSESETVVCAQGRSTRIPLSSSLPGGVGRGTFHVAPPAPSARRVCSVPPLLFSKAVFLHLRPSVVRKAPPSVVLGVAGVKGPRRVAAPLREV